MLEQTPSIHVCLYLLLVFLITEYSTSKQAVRSWRELRMDHALPLFDPGQAVRGVKEA